MLEAAQMASGEARSYEAYNGSVFAPQSALEVAHACRWARSRTMPSKVCRSERNAKARGAPGRPFNPHDRWRELPPLISEPLCR